MKKVILTASLFIASVSVFAQQGNVKEAKSIIEGTNPDFAKAEQLIGSALTDPSTSKDPATWDVAGKVQSKINEKENTKLYLKQAFDTTKMYNSILEMYKYFLKCDELAQIPNEKGKIKNKFRKENADVMLKSRPNLLNGFVQYLNAGDNAKALEFFQTYADSRSYPMLADAKLESQNDTIMNQYAYYAVAAAFRSNNYAAVKKFAPFGMLYEKNASNCMQILAEAYKAEKDSVDYLKTIQEGVKKYPTERYFLGSIIDYYSSHNQNDKAMQFADEQLKSDPNNKFMIFVKAYLYQTMKDYDNAVTYYEKATQLDPTYADAFSNLGLTYVLKAQVLSEKATTNVNSPKYKQDQAAIKALYEKARPYYEKARELKPDNKDLWARGLYRVYYCLNMAPQFEEMEKLLGLDQKK
jgi:tetratricopeptide (TPR) repeat protein